MKRREFIGGLLGVTVTSSILTALNQQREGALAPALFVGHGSPMNVLANNRFTQLHRELGETLPAPQAILVVSAHWVTSGTKVQVLQRPKQIFDFYGFPKELYQVQYQPEGSPAVGKSLAHMNSHIHESEEWGLDHGAWSVLHWMYPAQNIPVLQLSLDRSLTPAQHLDLARSLVGLRSQGVMVLGSGNLVHNLGEIAWDENAEAHTWAAEYEAEALSVLTSANLAPDQKLHRLVNHSLYQRAHPTPEHLWPLIYTLAVCGEGRGLKTLTQGIQNAAISMAVLSAA